MGSCFSSRKRSDAGVTHTASPRNSFSVRCQSDAVAVLSPLGARKPSDEIAVVVSKSSAPFLANAHNIHASEKKKGTKAMCAQKTENAPDMPLKTALQDSRNAGHYEHSVTQQKMEKERRYDGEASADCKSSFELTHLQEINKAVLVEDAVSACAIANAYERGSVDIHATKRCIPIPTSPLPESAATPTLPEIKLEDKEMLLPIHDKPVTEAHIIGNVLPSSIVKLKHSRSSSRSCEETTMLLPETKKCYGRSSFQDNSTFSSSVAQLQRIPEPLQFGTTKFLEGLDLVDVLPHRLSLGNQSRALLAPEDTIQFELTHHENGCLQAGFFAFKNSYLSSYRVSPHNALASDSCPGSDDGQLSVYSVSSDAAEDHIASSSDLMHSRASSLDTAEHTDMVGLHSLTFRHPISVVEEVDENECGSDDSDTFDFEHLVSVHGGGLNLMKVSSRNRVIAEEEEAEASSYCGPNEPKETPLPCHEKKKSSRVKELSVVATGDALLYTGSNSEEFDLIPSKCYFRGSSPKRVCIPSLDALHNENIYYPCQERLAGDDQVKTQPSSLSVDDIIMLLEKDALDEDVLLSFLNLSNSPASMSHGDNMRWSHTSDVASETSFEFKIKSLGSTPISMPSTPNLSAGSTPKKITQLSPLALTSEEIAEIWGVFEQKQCLSLSNM